MENHYETLGISSSASSEEIRRAYRVLARRYHPDVNPGKPAAEERFKKIAAAYAVLSEPDKKRTYDEELERLFNADKEFGYRNFQESQRRQSSARKRYMEAQAKAEQIRKKTKPGAQEPKKKKPDSGIFSTLKNAFSLFHIPKETSQKATKVSVIEVSVTIKDALYGVKKTVELAEPEHTRKISVAIPPGVRNGSLVHLRSKSPYAEELVIIVRVPSHPYLSIQTRGLVAEMPISLQEAICGATVTLPTLEEPISVKIPPGTSSGQEIRIPGRGLQHRDGSRGDLFIRFLIQVPESPDAVGLKDKAREFEQYYASSPREKLPKTLLP